MKKDKTKFYLTLSTMGLEMGLSLVVGFFLGQFLDKKLRIKSVSITGVIFRALLPFALSTKKSDFSNWINLKTLNLK